MTVDAGYTKNRIKAVQPLPQSIVPLLRNYLQGMPPDRPVWPVSKGLTNLMVQKDMEEAGIPVEVDGKTFDFHGLRGQFATRLALAGVGLANDQKFLSNSDHLLTSTVYTHLTTEDLAKEVDKLG